MKDVLADVEARKAGSNGAASAGSGSIDTSALKAKLAAAVEAMQEGLVERDTEVGNRLAPWIDLI